tara:strand:+ start:311 stop:592 length:282 start_codon:yes stop_codon:yes gene_type:complete
MKKKTLRDLEEYSAYLDLFSNLSLLNKDANDNEIGSANKTKYQVENLKHLLEVLKSNEIKIENKILEDHSKRYSFIFDKEGNKIELWEPVEMS